MRYCDFQAQLCDHLVTSKRLSTSTPTPVLIRKEAGPKHRALCETCRSADNFAITINLNEDMLLLLAILIVVVLLLR